MKLPDLRKLWRREEQRSITGLPWDVGGPVSQGPVTADQALSLVPVFAAVRILAAQIASLPLQSYRKVGDQRTKIPTPSLFASPSVIGTQFDWIHRCVTSMALRGNAYGLVTQRNSLGYPSMIEWLHPDHVQVQDKAFSGPGSFTNPIWYWRGRTVPAEQMVHIPWFTVPYRVKGLSPMEACAAAVLTGVSAQDYTANWFLNGAVPPGVFKNIQKTIEQKEADEIKSRLSRAIKTRAPLVHGNDWDYSPIAVAAHEAKFIETLKLTATQIANIYGVPPDQVGGDAGASGMTYRNENNSGLDFVKYTLRSWLEPLEEKFSSLLPQPQFVKFNLDAILRADLPTRMAAYVEARNIGIMNVDEIRALEDLPPLPDGKGQDYTPLLVQVSQSRGIDAAQVKADQPPSTPAVAQPTRLRAVVGIDDAEVLEIDAGPKGGPLPGASASVALEARRRDPSDPLAMERKFDPSEPRRPDGKWGSGSAVHDALKLADRIKLGQDERLVGSAKVGDGRGDYSTVMARVDGPDGPRLRFGVVDTSEGTRKWRASNGGATVVLDEHGVGELRRVIADAQAKGPRSVADYRADIKARHARGEPESKWPLPEADIAKGTIRGSAWGDIEWTLTREEGPNFSAGGVDYGPGGAWLLSLDVKATDNKLGPLDSFDIYATGVAQKLDGALAGLMGMPANQRAAGHDTTPGHDQLHHYWTRDPEGLAKWVDSPKPWTTLREHLLKYLPPEEATKAASKWFEEVFGFAAGSDLNRVTHGKPPRGHKVGPG